jgi:hypothetical protein
VPAFAHHKLLPEPEPKREPAARRVTREPARYRRAPSTGRTGRRR